MKVFIFPAHDGTLSKKVDLTSEEVDLILTTKKLWINVFDRYERYDQFLVCTISLSPDPKNPFAVPFDISLSVPWQPPSFIPFVPQNMYDDLARHRELWVNMKNNKGIFFTTYEV